MKLFICKITGKEIFTDASKYELVDDAYYIVKGKIEASSNEIDESAIGGNKSAEGGDEEAAEVHVAIVSSLVNSCKLEENVPIASKKDFKGKFSAYCKKITGFVKEESPDRLDHVKSAMQKKAMEIIGDFGTYQWYAAEDDGFDCDGAPIPHKTINSDSKKGDQVGDVCEIIVWKDGVREEKC
ncbi:translationally-controlled tumor protein homolog [Clytia hemisphaerica]|uniref:TCTP domain-containing protein n=1 Tax=Clytia hemisphaerica TaxID=252671 RepID=A0A7M5WZ21_9CNID|eukprot:TCONS_00002287-protein